MQTQVINDNSCIRVINGDIPLIISKMQIKTIDTVKNELVRIDIGEGPLKQVYIKFSEVTMPEGLGDVNALRDAIKAMLDGSGSDLSSVVQSLAEVKQSVDATGVSQATLLGSLLTVMGQLKDQLLGADAFRNPVRMDEEDPGVVYYGYALRIVGADPTPLPSVPSWAIQRVSGGGRGVFVYEWANGNQHFDNIWDNRATLNYQALPQ